jgi:hypothetical protein
MTIQCFIRRQPRFRAIIMTSSSSCSTPKPVWANKYVARHDDRDDDLRLPTYQQKKHWRIDCQTVLAEVDMANRAGFGYYVDKQLVETGKVWTAKGVQNYPVVIVSCVCLATFTYVQVKKTDAKRIQKPLEMI